MSSRASRYLIRTPPCPPPSICITRLGGGGFRSPPLYVPLTTTTWAVVGPLDELVAVLAPVLPALACSTSCASLLSKSYRLVIPEPAVHVPESKFTNSATTSSFETVVVTAPDDDVLVLPAYRPLLTSIGLAWFTLLYASRPMSTHGPPPTVHPYVPGSLAVASLYQTCVWNAPSVPGAPTVS